MKWVVKAFVGDKTFPPKAREAPTPANTPPPAEPAEFPVISVSETVRLDSSAIDTAPPAERTRYQIESSLLTTYWSDLLIEIN